MKLLDNKKCIIISWDQDQHFYGVKFKCHKHKRLQVLDAVSSKALNPELTEDVDPFVVRLSEVYKTLYSGEQYLVILTGVIPESVCCDIRMPKMAANDLEDAIQYEIPRYMPIDLGNLFTGFRIVRQEEQNSVVRVFATQTERWDKLLTQLTEAKVKIDFVIHPFMAVDPWMKEAGGVSLEQLYPGFAMQKNEEDKLWHGGAFDQNEHADYVIKREHIEKYLEIDESKSSGDPMDDQFIPCLFMAGYVVSDAIQKDQQTHLAPPKTLKTERFRGLKVLFFLMLAIVAGLILAFMGRVWWENRRQYMKVEKEIVKIKRLNTKTIKAMRQYEAHLELIEKLCNDNLGNRDVFQCLTELTSKIPREYHVTNLSSNGYKFDVTLQSEEAGSIDFVNRLRLLKVLNKHTRKTSRGVNTYLTLQYDCPRSRMRNRRED